MDAPLPSYHDAIRQSDWLDIVAPYCSVKDYTALCLVSHRFYERFAYRLWKNPLRTVRRLGLHRENELNWYFKFINRQAPRARPQTRALVATLDFRGFAHAAADFYSDLRESSVSGTFRRLAALFPRLRAILLDGHPELDPGFLARSGLDADAVARGAVAPPLLLSVASCRSELLSAFFESPYLARLVYLDVSDVPGSLRGALAQGTFGPRMLPDLRVLKARGREMDDATAASLLRVFKRQLWSLDLSYNYLTDAIVPCILAECIAPIPLRTASHFAVEGTVIRPKEAGSDSYGPFDLIEESAWSASFSHPERYLVDAPVYVQDESRPIQELYSIRRDGRIAARPDDSDRLAALLTGPGDDSPPSLEDVQHLEISQADDGLTHLYLDGNRLSAHGVGKLLKLSNGRLQRFECDATSLDLPPAALSDWMMARPTRLFAFVEETHALRPVISSNLQILRLHQSIVTQTPSLEAEGMREMAAMWIAETFLAPRVALAYPQPLTPDTNPRLVSLTLSRIPRYSTGFIIERLLRFLKLASIQERKIQEAAQSFPKRTASALRGLRHIRLEFDADPKEEELGGSSGEDDDQESHDLLDMAAKEFSFFGELGWGGSSSTSSPTALRRASTTKSKLCEGLSKSDDIAIDAAQQSPGVRPPLAHRLSDPEDEHVPYSGSWNATDFQIPVWVGPGELPLHPAANEYMRLLRDPALRGDVRPASPQQVLAGVPMGSYIYQDAWNAMLLPRGEQPQKQPKKEPKKQQQQQQQQQQTEMPQQVQVFGEEMLEDEGLVQEEPEAAVAEDEAEQEKEVATVREPKKRELRAMRDVVAALKEYRQRTKAAYVAAQKAAGRRDIPLGEPHFFWTGKLEVALADATARYQSSKYWR